jgi:type I restriction enzyme, S subunit
MKQSLEELCEFINGGAWSDKEYSNEGIPVLKVSNLQSDRIDFSKIDLIPETSREKYSKHILKKDDLVIATVGSHPSLVNSAAGRASIIPKIAEGYLLNQNAVCLRTKNQEVLDQKYLAFTGKTQFFQHFIQQRGKGAANQMRIAIGAIKEFEIILPHINIQRRIASILSAYDDLIENNLKRIKLLEELAQRTYEEWFVRFKFPGHENTPINKETGLPEGWEKVKLGELCEKINYGYTASATDRPLGPKFLRITDIVPDNINWQNVPYCEIHEKELSKYLLLEGDIVIARTGATVGYAKRINKHHKKAIFASYLIRLRMHDKLDNIIAGLFIESKNFKNYVLSVAGGAAQPNANAPVLTGILMVVPKYDIQKKFRTIMEPILDLKEMLLIQNTNLKESRDILLPRLMGGVIEVDGIKEEELLIAAEPKPDYFKNT